MLIYLKVQNFALLENVEMELFPGFNVLTGETGAGKSLLVDAVTVALGGRASTDYIRENSNGARVEMAFSLPPNWPGEEILKEIGISLEEDGTLILSREISRQGKSFCRVNGILVPLSQFRRLGDLLVDIHGQHEHQSLLKPEYHLGLLDNFDPEVNDLSSRVKEIFQKFLEVRTRLAELKEAARERARREDLYRFQLEEIDGANLLPGEEEDLWQEKNLMLNGERLASLAGEAYDLLAEGDQETSISVLLARFCRCLKDLSAIDGKIMPLVQEAEDCYYRLKEMAADLLAYREGIQFDPSRLEEVEERLALISRLKKKYGNSIAEILSFRDEVASALASLEQSEEEMAELEAREKQLLTEYSQAAGELTQKRKEVAQRLGQLIEKEMNSLEMGGGKFSVNFIPLSAPSPRGLEKVEFLLSTNPGEPLKPLAKVASGGEISRIMLAIKTVLAAADTIPTLIFDEIDTGISGRAALAVGERLARLGREAQVICVTHSPVIASFAKTHFFLSKEVHAGRTLTRVKRLEGEERVGELARLLGGETETALNHARELLRKNSI